MHFDYGLEFLVGKDEMDIDLSIACIQYSLNMRYRACLGAL